MRDILIRIDSYLTGRLIKLYIAAGTVVILSLTTIAVSLAVFVVVRVIQVLVQ